MKYIRRLYFFTILFSITSNAQNLEVGLRTGLNLSTLRTGDNTGTNFTGSTASVTRLNLSVTSEYNFSNHFSLDASLGYNGKGGGDFDEESILRIGIDNFERKIEYLSASLLLRYYPLNNDKFKPFVTLGPGFSYMISAQELANKINEEDIKNKLDISSIAGIGIKLFLDDNLNIEVLGGIDRGWNKTLRQLNPTTSNTVFESLFNDVFWFSIGIKKTL